jgi:hypothetical protein
MQHRENVFSLQVERNLQFAKHRIVVKRVLRIWRPPFLLSAFRCFWISMAPFTLTLPAATAILAWPPVQREKDSRLIERVLAFTFHCTNDVSAGTG